MKDMVSREPVVCLHPLGIALALALIASALVAGAALGQPPAAMPASPQPVGLVLENQFDQPAGLADHRGSVVRTYLGG